MSCEELVTYFRLVRHSHIENGATNSSSDAAAMMGWTHRLVGGIYEVCHQDGFSCHGIGPSFTKTSLGIQKLMGGGGGMHRHTQTAW